MFRVFNVVLSVTINPNWRSTFTYALASGTYIQISQVEEDFAHMYFVNRQGHRTNVPSGLTVVGQLGGPTGPVNDMFPLALRDDFTISHNGHVILSIVNHWHITHRNVTKVSENH